MGEDGATFTHGVASFEPTGSSVLLWTRLGRPGPTTWELATDPDVTRVVASGEAAASADDDCTVVVDAVDLDPATTYWYRFRADGATSPIGRTRTLPGLGAEHLRLATVCCSRYSVAPLTVYRAVAEREVDLVVHLGDYIYEDDGSAGPRRHDPPHVATTLDDYRRRIAQVRADPDTQALHRRHPMVAIWDDHDLADNAWSTGAKAHDPDEHGPWRDRAAAAARARREWLPARLRDPDEATVTWRSVEVGDLAELVLLDTRYHGRDRQAGDDDSPDLHDPDRSLLGAEQREWLRQRIADVDRPWTVVASGVVINEIELRWPPPLRWIDRLLPNGYAVIDGHVMHDDQWDGYPAERDRLTSWLARRGAAGGRALLLSGDVHSSWAFEGPRTSDGAPVAVEVTTPAVSSEAMGRAHPPAVWRLLDREANRLGHVPYAEVTERGYCTIDLGRDDLVATWWHLDPWADDPTATQEAAATFRSERRDWPPRLDPETTTAPDPVRPGLPDPLPPRPADLASLRRRRTARLAAEGGAAAVAMTACAAAILVLGRRALRRRR
ncbi:alkaline phosphatase D family protein [Dermatobacter hominis]|uniref:alkaline phosphatase D family protein n=1 Tax=Dermatobacter hominis TaxID=2884263 RepID=UPI001D0FC04D|nr:alkaline phosphatase D family protein [Dermatobacter hominis]UDY34167.1 alkaline phosphatase D family protein [Dermatobacter hominis]